MTTVPLADYGGLVTGISELLDSARRTSARTVNGILTATYWEIGRRIVEYEQAGDVRAEYGERLLERLAVDLRGRLGRGFTRRTLYNIRGLYLGWRISPAASGRVEARAIVQTAFAQFSAPELTQRQEDTGAFVISGGVAPIPSPSILATAFPLSWSHYIHLMSVPNPDARAFYEAEAIRGGWSVRQLGRQIATQFFERTSRSKRREAILARASRPQPENETRPEDEVRDPYLLEFLNLKDEYGESDLEEALVRHLESFLLELGSGFTFVARQKRIRVGDSWFRIDLVLYHRALRCLVLVDLKTGAFNHADAGQMNLYLNFAREHMTLAGENDPVGIILCSGKDDAVVKYAIGGIQAQVFASKYLTDLPDEETLRREIMSTRRALGEGGVARDALARETLRHPTVSEAGMG
jgi:predicted nuclease of restriction endonuclease-like (RecB) superfamily